MKYVIYLILAIIIGGLAKLFLKNSLLGGIVGLIIAAFLGSWLVDLFLSSIKVYGVNLLPAILGAVIFIYLYNLLFGKKE
ncbi:MAG: GlsB/YeaQ/YmgE family stress response membrane protein [bacterium]